MDKIFPSTKSVSLSIIMTALDLKARLTRAMAKAGVTEEVTIEECQVSQDYYNVIGVKVKASDPALAERAAKWIEAVLTKAGVKEWHLGAWQGPCIMGEPRVMKHRTYGEDIVMVRTHTISIGD